MVKRFACLILAILLTITLAGCGISTQDQAKAQTLAEELIRDLFDVDYTKITNSEMEDRYKKNLTEEFYSSEGEYIADEEAEAYIGAKTIQHVEQVKLAGMAKEPDGTYRIGAAFVLNFVSGGSNFYLQPDNKYVFFAIIRAKDTSTGLKAIELPDIKEAGTYTGSLPNYVTGVDKDKDSSGVFSVMERYYRIIHDVDFTTFSLEKAMAVFNLCSQGWMNENSTSFPSDLVAAITEDETKERINLFKPNKIEYQGINSYLAEAYIVIKHISGQGETYQENNIEMGKEYLYLAKADIVYESGSWKYDLEEMGVFAGEYTGTFPDYVPGTAEEDYDKCIDAAQEFTRAELNIDYTLPDYKLNAHYQTMGTSGLLEMLQQNDILKERLNNIKTGQLKQTLTDFFPDNIDNAADPAGGLKIEVMGTAAVQVTSATAAYLTEHSMEAGKLYSFSVYVRLAFRDGKWKIDGYEISQMGPYEPGGEDDVTPPEESAEDEAAP
ncbi:MAG: hypothetical protein Q8O09_04740 [Bacillota bacterium]|nr:hypothetical protein [Bacillota bacterium]